MNLSLAAFRVAVAATVLWILKAIAIGTAGGLGRSPFENPLYLLGLAAAVVAVLLAGASYAEGRRWPWKVLGAVVAFVVTTASSAVDVLAVAALTPPHAGWAWTELTLWVLAVALLAATGARLRHTRRHAAPHAPGVGQIPQTVRV